MRAQFAIALSAFLWLPICVPLAWGQAAAPQELDEEAARQKQIVDRFLIVLERNPRRGTALDKIYGFHIENGTIEGFAQSLRDRVAKKPDDGAGWMILGLIESQRGRDAAAVEALTKAKTLRTTDALAAYYLGQSLVLVGQPENAAAAFEEAIARKPAQADLLEIFQALGRVHQRAARTQEALAVWSRLEKLFPSDPRVQEQIATTLVEEGQATEALPRYEALAKSTTDDYRRTVYRMEAADIKVKLNRAAEGIADLEQLLAKLNPESWLFREVRRKIEEVFLRTDDQDGLTKYYTRWLETNKEDIEAMARLARVLARQARVPEARDWLDKALKLAPSRKELRQAFIDQLVDDQRYPEAIQQYVALDKADPNNPDVLREWGKLILRDASRPKEERHAEAEKIWNRLIAARPNDPLVAAQVADLCRHAGMSDQALALYQKAVELAPAAPQYREYLGEYYHILKRPQEALATWRPIAEGKERTAANLTRLAEVLAQFGYLTEALPQIAAACELDPKDFSLQLKAADMQIRAEQYDTALESLARAEKLSQNDEEREAVLAQQIKTYTLQSKLTDLAMQLASQISGGSATAKQWFLLARYREALHEFPEAARAISEALKQEPANVPSLAAAARIAEQSGELGQAAELNRKLAVADRRGRSEYLQHVAKLETQLGRIDEALAAGRDLIAAAPGNVETYQFFSDLCFRLGRADEGITALRRAMRVNPSEPSLVLALASALAGQFRTDEAIELYWLAFEKGRALDERLGVIGKLTELYLQTNHLDQLLERLERGRREVDQRREMTICLAQAYQSAGDYGMARQELERLLNENTRDTQLLLQLSKLAESESDLASAIKYQEQLAKLAPGDESEYRLATLLSRAGDTTEASSIMVRLAIKEEDQEKVLRNIDTLLTSGQEETALAILEPKLRENSSDWELLYRQAAALAKKKPDEAGPRFVALLDLPLSDDELSAAAKNRQKNAKSRAVASSPLRARGWRLDSTWEIRRAIGLDYDNYSYASGRRPTWSPQDFGLARLASLGFLTKLAQAAGKEDAFIAERRAKAAAAEATPRELWDWVYLQGVRQDQEDVLPAGKRLAERGGYNERLLYLFQLASRGGDEPEPAPGKAGEDKTPPLAPEDLNLALRCLDEVRRMSSEGEHSLRYYAQAATFTILKELSRAGRKEEEQQRYREFIDKAATEEDLISALELAQRRRDRAAVLTLFERFAAKNLQTAEKPGPAAAGWQESASQGLAQYIGQPDAAPPEIQKAVSLYLSYHAAKTNIRRSSPTFRPASRATTSRQNNYVYVWSGNSQNYHTLSFPTPSDYFSQQSLGLLRTAFEAFRTKDLASDLVKYLESQATQVPAAERLYVTLALGYLQVWNDDRESAGRTLVQAADLVPQDMGLRLEVARLQLEMQQFDEALALADAIAPLDQRTMQERETLSLELAVRLGDQQRARDAAQRLFGLRLDAETQVTLAGQMRRLGMNEEAEAVLARAQRQAGSRLSALSALMGQYQADGKMDVAAQVAFQILRRSRTAPAAQAAAGYSTADSQSRTAALACLSQAGKLKELIAGLEEQLQRAPQAVQLSETLAEYYQAAGETQKMLDLQGKLVALRPDDADLRYRYGQELYRRGKLNEACEQYLVVVNKEPQLLARRYWEVAQAFQRANKQADLARALAAIDLKRLGQPYVITNLMNYMMQSGGTRAELSSDVLIVFKKAWETFPEMRSQLMSQIHNAEAWKLPEVVEYGKKSLIPTAVSVRNDSWLGLHSISSWGQNGQVTSLLSQVLDGTSRTNQLAQLRTEVVAAVSQFPQWKAGPAILAAIDVRQGKTLDLSAVVQPLLDVEGNDYTMRYARWVLAQELEAKPAYRDLAIKLYERASAPSQDDNDAFMYTPQRRLVELYKNSGQREKARQVLLTASRREPRRDQNFQYQVSQYGEGVAAIGGLLQEMDLPIDALRVYRQLLIRPEFSDPSISSYTGRQPEYFHNQARQGIQGAVRKFGQNPSAELVTALLTPEEKATPGAPVIDLMLAATAGGASTQSMPGGAVPYGGTGNATSGSSALPTLDSPLVSLIRPTGIGEAALGQIESQIATLVEKHPADLSVHIAASLFALKGTDTAKVETVLTRLNKLVESSPLEELPAGKRANSRQRAQAAEQIGLWLVARECWKDKARRELAEPLARRAALAAQRQLDSGELSAILYERGRLALSEGDRAAAEQSWSELIDRALIQPRLPRASVSTSTNAAPSAPRSGKMPATLSQFKLGGAIAQAAAESGLVALSLSAIREALSGGVPVADLPQSVDALGGRPRIVRSVPGGAMASRGDIDQAVYAELSSRMKQLSLAWKAHDFPAGEVCQLLEEVVFPAARPKDVLIYEQPLTNDLSNPISVGRLLAEWAIRAGRVSAVEQQIAARQGTPTDIVSGQVLLVQLAVGRRDNESVKSHLQAILKQLEASKLSTLVGLASHAAAAALGDAELTTAAIPLLEKLANIASSAPTSGRVITITPGQHSALTTVIREYLKQRNMAAATGQVDRYLQSRQEFYGRYVGGDNAAYYQKLDLAWAANELARGSDLNSILTALGRFADVTVARERDVPLTVALWHLNRQLHKLPAQERYERLRDWSLPTKDRRSVRFVVAFDSGQPIPEIFLGQSALVGTTYESAARTEPISNVTLLVQAADEAGRLEELSQLVEPLAAEKAPGAESLALLTLIARRDHAAATKRLQLLAARWQESISRPAAQPATAAGATPSNQEPPPGLGEYLAVRAALAEPALAVQAHKIGRLFLDVARRSNQIEVVAHVSNDLARSRLFDLSPADQDRVLKSPLVHWMPGTRREVREGTRPTAWWTVHDGHLVHLTGCENDALYFNVPLEGEFEFSYDTFTANYSLSGVAYGGVLCGAQYYNGTYAVSSVSQHDNIIRPGNLEGQETWNRVAIRVSPASVRFLVNGHLVYEDKTPGRTSPWLHLQVNSERAPAMKNFRLTGKPTIPREVKLVDADRLDGWIANWFSEQMPQRLRAAELAQNTTIQNPRYVVNAAGESVLVDPNAPQTFDWHAEDGVLEGRLDSGASPRAQSRIYYHRPLAGGERITYQFLYEPGKTHVHPTLGRIAFLLEPAGLVLHWITRPTDAADPLLLDSRNSVEDLPIRRGPAALPLKENDWNDVELAVTGDVLSIFLNGSLIGERPIESTSDRRFGLFHYKAETAVKVRGLALRGNWPERLDEAERADLLAVANVPNPAINRARHALVGERILSTGAFDVWKQSRGMASTDKYEFLKQWVLPSDLHPTLRLNIDWTPTDPPPMIAPMWSARSASEPLRHSGGDLVSPALELVTVAKELGKLDELSTAAFVAAKEFPDQARPAASFELLLAIARGDAASAASHLKRVLEFVKQQPAYAPVHERHAECLAAHFALSNPATRNLGLVLAEQIVNDQKQPRYVNAEWERRVRRLRAEAQWATDRTVSTLPFGGTQSLAQWFPVSRATAQTRGEGVPPPAWKLAPGEATYMTGNGRDALYFNTPLTGDFEVRCQRSTFGWREIRLLYGGVAFDFKSDAQTLERQEVGRALTTIPLKEKIKNWAATVDYRLVVKDGAMTALVNGQEVHSERLPANVDPWLAIETHNAQHSGTIKNLQILGSPTVPREIHLSQGPSLTGWLSDYYGEQITGETITRENANWSKKSDEIVATKLNNAGGSFRESILQYHRPLQDDCEVEYEFFYEAGKFFVHPALDRMVLLLSSRGVRVHWLTDGQYDRTRLAPDNAEPLAGSKAVPLKPGQWNTLKLILAGDEVTIVLNGQETARRKLEPTNSRVFGLFRYSNANGVRVRNVVLRGKWPAELIPVAQQELAAK